MTEVQMNKSTFWGDIDHPARSLRKGETVDVPEEIAVRWTTRSIASYVVGAVTAASDAVAKVTRPTGRVPGLSELVKRQ